MNILSWVVLALVGSTATAIGAESQSQSTVVVRPLIAEFTIPVAHEGPWRWARAETSDNSLEFNWILSVKSGGEKYQFGFSYFKYPGTKERTGNLAELLKAGQASLWKIKSDGAGTLVVGANVSATAGDGRVVVTMSNPADVRLLFGDRPPVATILTRTPDDSPKQQEVSIKYAE